jgi:hypothetical protein
LVFYGTIGRPTTLARVLGYGSAATFGALAGATIIRAGVPTTVAMSAGAVTFRYLVERQVSRHETEPTSDDV